MPRTCTICAHKDRKIIDAMIANKDPYLAIARKFSLNTQTVNNHGKAHVLPFLESIELQAQAAVLARVRTYRDEVNLPLPEKAKYIENKLWDDYDAARHVADRMAVISQIAKQQGEQAKLSGAYTKERDNPTTVSDIAQEVVDRLVAKGYSRDDALKVTQELYAVSDSVH